MIADVLELKDIFMLELRPYFSFGNKSLLSIVISMYLLVCSGLLAVLLVAIDRACQMF